MRYILLLAFYCFTCGAQEIKDNTKVIAYTFGVMPITGSCHIGDYFKDISAVGTTIQATVSYDANLARNLIKLKREAKNNWPAEACNCKGQQYTKAEIIPNAYVVQLNGYRDTIYTTKNNCAVFIPESGQKYFDGESRLLNELERGFPEFLGRDFEKEINERVYDSVSVNSIQINKKKIFNKTRRSFEKDIAPFQMVRTDSIYGKNVIIKQVFWLDNIEVIFSDKGQVQDVNVHHPKGGNTAFVFTLDGFTIGDSEELLLDKYTCSTIFRNWGASLKDPEEGYYYQVSFTGAKGFAFFHIWEKKIYAIEVTFFAQ